MGSGWIASRKFIWERETFNPHVFYHGSDSLTPFKRFNTTEVWFDSVPRDYGNMDVEVYYRWKQPFVTQVEEAEHFGVTEEQATENLEQYRAWGGEANPQSFENIRTLGYDFLVDYEGYAALYPKRIKILRFITREGKIIRDYRDQPRKRKPAKKTMTSLRGIR